MVADAQRSRAPIQRTVDTVSAVFVPAVIAVAVVAFAVWALVAPTLAATAGHLPEPRVAADDLTMQTTGLEPPGAEQISSAGVTPSWCCPSRETASSPPPASRGEPPSPARSTGFEGRPGAGTNRGSSDLQTVDSTPRERPVTCSDGVQAPAPRTIRPVLLREKCRHDPGAGRGESDMPWVTSLGSGGRSPCPRVGGVDASGPGSVWRNATQLCSTRTDPRSVTRLGREPGRWTRGGPPAREVPFGGSPCGRRRAVPRPSRGPTGPARSGTGSRWSGRSAGAGR